MGSLWKGKGRVLSIEQRYLLDSSQHRMGYRDTRRHKSRHSCNCRLNYRAVIEVNLCHCLRKVQYFPFFTFARIGPRSNSRDDLTREILVPEDGTSRTGK